MLFPASLAKPHAASKIKASRGFQPRKGTLNCSSEQRARGKPLDPKTQNALADSEHGYISSPSKNAHSLKRAIGNRESGL